MFDDILPSATQFISTFTKRGNYVHEIQPR